MGLLFLLLLAGGWHLLVRWEEKRRERRLSLLRALERVEEELREVLDEG